MYLTVKNIVGSAYINPHTTLFLYDPATYDLVDQIVNQPTTTGEQESASLGASLTVSALKIIKVPDDFDVLVKDITEADWDKDDSIAYDSTSSIQRNRLAIHKGYFQSPANFRNGTHGFGTSHVNYHAGMGTFFTDYKTEQEPEPNPNWFMDNHVYPGPGFGYYNGALGGSSNKSTYF